MLYARLNRDHQEIRTGVLNSPVYFWLSLASAIDAPDQQERCELLDMTLTERNASDWDAEVTWKSSVWQEKKHFYRYRMGRLEHWIEIKGRGTISEVTYLSGTVGGQERASLPGFGAVFTGMPNFLDKPLSHPSEYTAISVGNVTELWGSALNSGPLMFAFGEHNRPAR